MRQRKTKEESYKIKEQCTTKREESKNAKNMESEKPVKSTKRELTEKAKPSVSINVDEFKGFYRHKDLNLHEIKYLLAKKYLMIKRFSIASGKVERFLIKPRFNESINHIFVTYDIAEFLEKKEIRVDMYITQKPDIVFNLNGTSYAVEVETGSVLTNKRKFLEKVKNLNKDYGKNWFFVVTKRNLVSKYEKFGKTVDKRYVKTKLQRVLKKSDFR